MQLTNKQLFWLWLLGIILFFLTIIIMAIAAAWIQTPTDWSITIMTDNNTKEIFYVLNESGVYD